MFTANMATLLQFWMSYLLGLHDDGLSFILAFPMVIAVCALVHIYFDQHSFLARLQGHRFVIVRALLRLVCSFAAAIFWVFFGMPILVVSTACSMPLAVLYAVCFGTFWAYRALLRNLPRNLPRWLPRWLFCSRCGVFYLALKVRKCKKCFPWLTSDNYPDPPSPPPMTEEEEIEAMTADLLAAMKAPRPVPRVSLRVRFLAFLQTYVLSQLKNFVNAIPFNREYIGWGLLLVLAVLWLMVWWCLKMWVKAVVKATEVCLWYARLKEERILAPIRSFCRGEWIRNLLLQFLAIVDYHRINNWIAVPGGYDRHLDDFLLELDEDEESWYAGWGVGGQ